MGVDEGGRDEQRAEVLVHVRPRLREVPLGDRHDAPILDADRGRPHPQTIAFPEDDVARVE